MANTDRYSADRDTERKFTLTSLGAEWEPPFDKVTSVAVVPIDTSLSRVVAVRLVDRGLDLPGGHTQVSDEGPLDTARRECAEEASIRIGDPVLVDVIVSDFYGTATDDLTYMLVYSAEVTELLPFAANEESADRVLVRPSDFLSAYTGDDPGSMGTWLAKALESKEIDWT
jgi:8-oxo-dGTP diphosphatase